MKIDIHKIEGIGHLDRERIVLSVNEETTLGEFSVFMANPSGPEQIEGGDIPHAFWFDEKKVKKGDLIILYTKSGTPREKANPNGATSYFFYWGLDKPSWSQYRAVIAQITDYDFHERLIDEDD